MQTSRLAILIYRERERVKRCVSPDCTYLEKVGLRIHNEPVAVNVEGEGLIILKVAGQNGHSINGNGLLAFCYLLLKGDTDG